MSTDLLKKPKSKTRNTGSGSAARPASSEPDLRRLNKELERLLAERTEQLQAANRELESFCYSVSHDLRAPLRAVRGFTEVLQEEYASQLDGRGQDFLRRVWESSAQMDRLVDDLLKLSRANRAELNAEPVDLSLLARGIVAELQSAEPDRKVEFAIAPDLRTHGDEKLLRVALDNLLRNAWKFTGPRSPARIEMGRTGDGAFFIRDNGVGFKTEYVGRLFGVFQRLHSATDFPGTGVGLALVQRLIARHGGRVWAEGQENAGATFYFALPVAEGSRNNSPLPPARQDAAGSPEAQNT